MNNKTKSKKNKIKKGINVSSAVVTRVQKKRVEKKYIKRKTKEITYFINSFKRTVFDKIKNPLIPWQIYLLCRKENVPIPKWVLKYFDDCANKLLDIKKPGKNAPSLCYEAIGFKSNEPRTPWANLTIQMERLAAVNRYEELKNRCSTKRKSKTKTEILEHVAGKFNIDSSTLRKWVKEYS